MAANVFDEVVEFKVKEKMFSLSGDAFKVKRESDGAELFQVSGNFLSFRDSKTMSDADGNDLYKMTEALITLRDRMYITDCATDETALTLRKKSFMSLPIFGGRTILAWKGGSDDGEPWLEIHGDLLKKDFTVKVVDSGEEAAVISRKLFSLSALVLDNDSYVVRVNPGYDAGLMVFLAIAIDEHYREEEEEEKGDDDDGEE